MNGEQLIQDMARRDPNPRRWAGDVSLRLLAILQIVRNLPKGARLARNDCAFIAGYFIYPNLVRWMWRIDDSSQSRPFQGNCPIFGGQPDCAQAAFYSPNNLPALRREDVCRMGREAHPWSLQVTLLFNANAAWTSRSSGGPLPPRQRPSRECAREVWERVIDEPSTPTLWNRVNRPAARAERNQSISPLWEAIANGISDAASQLAAARGNVSDAADASSLRTRQIAEFCWQTYQRVLNGWIGEQTRDLPRRLPEILRVLVGILRPVRMYAELRLPMPLANYRGQVNEFTALIQQLGIPGADPVFAYLERESLDRNGQILVEQFLVQQVLPRLSRDLPAGDLLDDPVIQDLFWHRVGSSAGRAGQPFEAGRWADRRWTPRDNIPNWRFSP